jgi:multidrug efflux pump
MEQGVAKYEAVVEAATARLRPILMTSLAVVLGAVPIAFALGAGAKSRVSLGIVIMGGMLFSLVLTLYIIPMMYLLLAAKTRKDHDHDPEDMAAEAEIASGHHHHQEPKLIENL